MLCQAKEHSDSSHEMPSAVPGPYPIFKEPYTEDMQSNLHIPCGIYAPNSKTVPFPNYYHPQPPRWAHKPARLHRRSYATTLGEGTKNSHDRIGNLLHRDKRLYR